MNDMYLLWIFSGLCFIGGLICGFLMGGDKK